jgi:hypothetical protein
MDRGFITAAVGFFSGRCHELLLWSLPWASFLIAAVGFFFCSRSHAFFLAPPEFFFSNFWSSPRFFLRCFLRALVLM